MESFHFRFSRTIDDASCIEVKLIFKETSNQEGLTNTAATIQCYKFTLTRFHIIGEFTKFCFSANNLFHQLLLN